MWINEHPDFHQWLTETFQIIDDKKSLNQAIYILYQSSKTLTLQLNINSLQQIIFFNKWKFKTVLLKSQQSLLEKILNKPRPYQSTRSAFLKWKLYIELQNVSALKSIIQISYERNQHLTNENNQLITQLWDTRKIHSSDGALHATY